jgi:hypothetical protein
MSCVTEATLKSMLLTDDNDAVMFSRVRKIFENIKNLGEMKFLEECRWTIDVEKLRVVRYGSGLRRSRISFFFKKKKFN